MSAPLHKAQLAERGVPAPEPDAAFEPGQPEAAAFEPAASLEPAAAPLELRDPAAAPGEPRTPIALPFEPEMSLPRESGEPQPAPLAAREAPLEGLEECDQHLALHLDVARQKFGPAALGVVDLPALGTARVVAEQVRVAAVLLWAREVEAAGVLPFVEALAEAVMRGAVMEPLGASASELVRFWRGRSFRMAEPERRALYARLFDAGTAEAAGFEERFTAFVDALAALGREARDRGTAGLEARISVMATELGTLLSDRAVGIAAFAARDIVAQVRWSMRLLQNPDLARGLGGGSLALILSRHGERLLRRPLNPLRHFARATAGMRLIGWIAERSQGGARPALTRSSPIIREAEAWRAASGGGR